MRKRKRTKRLNNKIRGQSFGAASPCRHINPTSVTVAIPINKPTVIPPGIEIPFDNALRREWKRNPLQMHRDGYRLRKIDGKWRAFHTKKSA
jgi:hypothetical protein